MCQVITLDRPRFTGIRNDLLLQVFLRESDSTVYNMDPIAYEQWRMKKVLEYKTTMEIPEEQPLDAQHIADCRAWIIGDKPA